MELVPNIYRQVQTSGRRAWVFIAFVLLVKMLDGDDDGRLLGHHAAANGNMDLIHPS